MKDSYYLYEEALSKDDFPDEDSVLDALSKFLYDTDGKGGYVIKGFSYGFKPDEAGGIEELVIPIGVSEIADNAFQYCRSIKRVRIYSDLKRIGNCAFMECSGLVEINLPDTLTEIGYCAFEYCASMVSFTLPPSIEKIGNDAFWGCWNMMELIDRSSLGITRGSDSHGYVAKYAKLVHGEDVSVIKREGDLYFMTLDEVPTMIRCNSSGEEVTLPPLFEGKPYRIKSNAFEKLSDLQSVTLPEGLLSIGSAAFIYCYSLRELTFPDGITEIPDYVFRKCYALESVTVPASVTRIGSGSFLQCNSLRTICYKGTKKQWRKIKILKYNKPLKKAKKIFEG